VWELALKQKTDVFHHLLVTRLEAKLLTGGPVNWYKMLFNTLGLLVQTSLEKGSMVYDTDHPSQGVL
jgi:hypothetical protein